MSITEELGHKKVQAVYLRKLLENVNEEIAELECHNDDYCIIQAAAFKQRFSIRITKQGMTGKLSAEVISLQK